MEIAIDGTLAVTIIVVGVAWAIAWAIRDFTK